jgi:protein SERAC1
MREYCFQGARRLCTQPQRFLLARAPTERDEANSRPIIFVVHSLGGLVCADMLLASRNSAEEHLQTVISCTRQRWLARVIGFIKQTNSQILGVLEHDSEVLCRIQADFQTMIRLRARDPSQAISITCFYEELGLPGIGVLCTFCQCIIRSVL